MADTHDYSTRPVLAGYLGRTHVLVGESGGLSAVYDLKVSALVPSLVEVETEHGVLLLDPEKTMQVLAG